MLVLFSNGIVRRYGIYWDQLLFQITGIIKEDELSLSEIGS